MMCKGNICKVLVESAAVAAWCPPMMQTAGVAFDESVPTAETPEPDSAVAQAA